MTYPGTPVQPARPGTVTAAVYILFVLAVIQLINVVVQVSTVGPTVEAIRDYTIEVGDTTTGNTIATVTRVFGYVGAVLSLAFAAGFAILGLLVGRGRNAARITTWVLAGISLCCGVVGLAGSAAGNLTQGGGTGTNIDGAEMARRIEEALPSWSAPLTKTLGVVSVVCALALIILLALPASNDFFRRPADAGWEPPGGYPPPAGGAGFAGPGFGDPAFGGPPPPGDSPPPGTPPPPGPPPPGAPPPPGGTGLPDSDFPPPR
jgi:hypothetical protein